MKRVRAGAHFFLLLNHITKANKSQITIICGIGIIYSIKPFAGEIDSKQSLVNLVLC